MMGNENLTRAQIEVLLKFAQFFERYLINRGGILKDENREELPYRTARSLANIVSAVAARSIFTIGQGYLQRGYAHTA
jgi:hypothetical protein